MAKILVTGGAGYIGSLLSRLLLSGGHKVSVVDLLWFDTLIPKDCLDSPDYSFTKGDICDTELIEQLLDGVDFVVHAAAVVGEPASKKFPELTKKINYKYSTSLIDKAKQSGVGGFIFLSTCSSYGVHGGVAAEGDSLNPLSLYAETKVDVERYLMDDAKGIDWIICRLSTVYGASPRMRFDLTVNDFTLNAFLNKYLNIFLPYTYRPYIHVSDVANVISGLISNFHNLKNDVFNVGFEGENYQKIEIAEIVKRYILDTKIEVVERGHDLRDYKVDFSKLKRSLGITKKCAVEDGVKEIVELLKSGEFQDPRAGRYYNTSPVLDQAVCKK